MRWLVCILVVPLLAGCSAVDGPAAPEAAKSFVATFENGAGCVLELSLAASEPVIGSDLTQRSAWALNWSVGGKGCGEQWASVALDPNFRVIRSDERFCNPTSCDHHMLDFTEAGGLAPWGIHWPGPGPTTTSHRQSDYPVTIIDEAGWRGIEEGARNGGFGASDAFRFKPDGAVPQALVWMTNGSIDPDAILNRTQLTWGSPLPTIKNDAPAGRQLVPLRDAAPGAHLDVYSLGFTLSEAIDQARSDDAEFAAVLDDGCLAFAGAMGRGRAALLPDLLDPWSTERVDLTLTARSATAARSVVLSYQEDRLFSQPLPSSQAVGEGEDAAAPGPCLDVPWDGTTIESVRDALWQMPLVEDQLPCSWHVQRIQSELDHDPMYVGFAFDGHPETGTFWSKEFRQVAPERWVYAAYDVAHGWAFFWGLTSDEVRDLDAQRAGQRVPFTHDDRFSSWCRFEGGEPLPASSLETTMDMAPRR